MSRPQKMAGFTLVELMVTIAVLVVAISVAVPSFTTFMHNNAVQSAADELFDLLVYTRGEAASRGVTVTITAPSANDWAGDLSVEAANQESALRQLGSSGLGNGNANVIATAGSASFAFRPSGLNAAGNSGCITVCYHEAADVQCRYIGIQASGRILPPSTSKPSTQECGS